jgi:hypothetical protein
VHVLAFLGIGGGWAYAGPNGCHFVIGPIGYTMLIVPALAICTVAWKSFQKRRHGT